MGSGGTAVLTRAGSGIVPATEHAIDEGVAHRICLSWVDAICRGGVHCMSLYLRCTEGLSEANQAILEEASAVLATVAGPWIVAADWNFSPLVLAEAGWLKIVGGILFASELPTCNDSSYDYLSTRAWPTRLSECSAWTMAVATRTGQRY